MKKGFVITSLLCISLAFAACNEAQENTAAESVQSQGTEALEQAQKESTQEQTDQEGENAVNGMEGQRGTRDFGDQADIVTASAYTISYRSIVGEEKDVVYLGKPRKLNVEGAETYVWSSSDENVATVRDGIVTGWREGLVTITQKQGENVIQEWQFAVTTFNDGRQVNTTYELEREEIEALLNGEGGVSEPAFWQQKLNTIQDVITYFQLCGFAYSGDIPVLATANSNWLCYVPADVVLFDNFGYSDDITDAAGYLLQNDYEDWGYIYIMGSGLKHKCWFYEDGIYTYVDFAQLIRDIRDGRMEENYVPYQTTSLEELGEYIVGNVQRENTLSVLMISALGGDFMPPVYLSYIHDSSEIYHTHVVIGLEDAFYEGTKELFSNPDFDYEVISIPTEEIPNGVPRYGNKTGYLYQYE